ncbi:MAG TPA: NrfD/PsrC family molybdoenzyme membrane anchor subunit [Thermoplasmata archaeon]
MTNLEWGLPVVAKYLFGGLSAGAFVTYYLWQGFGMRTFRPLAKLAWISAAVFGLAIPTPIFGHLGQPGRWSELLTSFHWTSPMSWAGPILIGYLIAVYLNGRFFFYRDVVLAYHASKGLRRRLLRIILLTKPLDGPLPPTSGPGLKVTGGIAFILVLFFGYTGLELGIIPSRPLWANPINPLMFLLTGIVSGMAWVVLLWLALERRGEASTPEEASVLRSLALPALLGFFLAMNAVAFLTLAYASPGVQASVMFLATGEMAPMFVWVGLGAGVAVPALLLVANQFLTPPRRGLAALAYVLVLVGAFAQKYGLIAAGQYLAPPGGQTYSLWPTTGELIEFVAVCALVFFLFQVALWISPWRRLGEMRESVASQEATA